MKPILGAEDELRTENVQKCKSSKTSSIYGCFVVTQKIHTI